MTQSCRRCSDCKDAEHHWICNTSFGDKSAPEELQRIEFLCKHCPATGIECIVCGGDGIDVDSLEGDCYECGGTGVLRTDDLT